MPVVHPQAFGGKIELPLRDFPGVDLRSDMLGGHGMEDLTCRAVSRTAVDSGRLPDDPTGRAAGS